MSDPNNVDAYAAVLADLRAKRDRIDAAIAAIEDLSGGGAVQRSLAEAQSQPTQGMGPGAFLGMTIPDATKKLLASERRAMTNPEIWEKLKAGGLHLNSADPVNTVGSVISRRFDKAGDIVRVGRGTWGLAEWYPGRNFKAVAVKDELPSPRITHTETATEALSAAVSSAVSSVRSAAATLSTGAEVTAGTAAAAVQEAARIKPPWER